MSRQTSGTRKRDTDLLHELDDGIRKELRTRVAELLERDEARIRVPQDTVTIPAGRASADQHHPTHSETLRGHNSTRAAAKHSPWNDLAALERAPEELLDVLV